MSVSWRDYDGLPEDPWDTPYEASMRAAERERMREGWSPPMGWGRPVDPMCPAHNYGLVDGRCGMCEKVADEEAAAELAEPPLDEAA